MPPKISCYMYLLLLKIVSSHGKLLLTPNHSFNYDFSAKFIIVQFIHAHNSMLTHVSNISVYYITLLIDHLHLSTSTEVQSTLIMFTQFQVNLELE